MRNPKSLDRLLFKLGLEHRTQAGDARRDAYLAKGAVGPRGHAASFGGNDRDRRRREYRVDGTYTNAREDETGQQHRPGRICMGETHGKQTGGNE